MPHPATEIVVVGGGAIGLGIAWQAAGDGADVTLVDPTPGRGASWAAGGMLAPVTEVGYGEEALLRLNLASNEAWPSFASRLSDVTGMDVGYRRCGTLTVARDVDDNAALDDVFAFQSKLGLDVRRLSSRETRALEPALAPRTRGGILVEGDHQVDNRALLVALERACQATGVSFVRSAARALASDGRRVTGVDLDDGGHLGAARVVLAAGWSSATIGGLPPRSVPLRPVKGQLVHLRTAPGEPPLASRIIRGLAVYLVPREDGRLAVGATMEERGVDGTVTAGAVRTLLREAFALVPGVDELELTETVTGLRPASPDNAPLLGPGSLDGLVVATGHFRNGILLTPVTASTITELLATGRTPDLLAGFDPGRFSGGDGMSEESSASGSRPSLSDSSSASSSRPSLSDSSSASGSRPSLSDSSSASGSRPSLSDSSSASGSRPGMSGLTLLLNGAQRTLPADASVADAVAAVSEGAAPRVAVARNGEVVPRSAWRDTALAEGDRLEVLAPIQGGSG